MNFSFTSADSERLLEENRWVRALARSLVGDPELADELAQETWVRALEHPPEDDDSRSLTAWLAVVLRNLWRQKRRGDGRRRKREERVARDEGLPSTLELVERVATQREVAQAVTELEEPYRTTILLRYFEELPPRVIAERTGQPVSTVKTRIARGLEKLRARLDERYGSGRDGWLMALLPLAGKPTGISTTASIAGVCLVSSKLTLVLASAIVASSLFAFYRLRDKSPEARSESLVESPLERPSTAAAAPAKGEVHAALPHADAPGRSELQREAQVVAAPANAAPEPQGAAPAGLAVRGRALDAEGSPLPDVELGVGASNMAYETEEPLCRSGPDGRFVLELGDQRGSIVTGDARLTTVLAGAGTQERDREAIVVLAERLELGGRVVDEFGQPLARAQVRFELPLGFRSRFAQVLDYSLDLPRRTETDDEGRFTLPSVPRVSGSRLRVLREGYTEHRTPAPNATTSQLEFVLRLPGQAEHALHGRVVDHAGLAVGGARVSYGLDAVLTEADGSFAFDLQAEGRSNELFNVEPDRLIAVIEGFQPAVQPLLPGAENSFHVLRLGREALEVEGRVVDSSGEPVAGALVWVADTTLLGATKGQRRPAVLEYLVAGRAGRGWQSETTDADGRFRIHGLMDREYTIEAMEEATLLRAEPVLAAAGSTDMLLTLDEGAFLERVAGVVETRHGEPLAGIRVRTMCDAFVQRFQGRRLGTQHMSAGSTVTDAEGRFEFERVPQDLVYLRFDGEEAIPIDFGRGVEGGLLALSEGRAENLKVTMAVRCHLRVELDGGSPVDEIAVLDADGEELRLSAFQGNGRRDHERMPIVAGRSDVLAAPDTAVTLVLFSEGEELERRPVSLTPGEVTVLD